EEGQKTVDEIKAAGGEASFVKVDVSNAEQVKAMVQFAVDTYGRLDVGVNNAALTPDDKPADEFDEDYWDRLIAVDLSGAALCQKYELLQMKKQGDVGSIINISSVSGYRPQQNNNVYDVANHHSVGMTKGTEID